MVSSRQRCVLQQQGRWHPLGAPVRHSLLPPTTKHKLEAASVLTSPSLPGGGAGAPAHSYQSSPGTGQPIPPGTTLWLEANQCSGTFVSVDFPPWVQGCHFFQHRCTQAAPCIRWAICQENQPRTNGKPNGNSAGKQYFSFCSQRFKAPTSSGASSFVFGVLLNSPMFAAGASQKGCFPLTLGNCCSEVLKAMWETCPASPEPAPAALGGMEEHCRAANAPRFHSQPNFNGKEPYSGFQVTL